jgi:transcriptional regulator with XRE-family HTH domain
MQMKKVRNCVVTQNRNFCDDWGMTDRPNYRLISFQKWMETLGLNVNQVSQASGISKTTIYSFTQGKNRSMTGEIEQQIADAFDMTVEDVFANVRDGTQTEELEVQPANNLRAWREDREMSHEELAAKVGTTPAVIKILEEKPNLSSEWLRRLATALGTRPGYLLDYLPDQVSKDVMSRWAEVDPSMQDRALDSLTLFRRKTGTIE